MTFSRRMTMLYHGPSLIGGSYPLVQKLPTQAANSSSESRYTDQRPGRERGSLPQITKRQGPIPFGSRDGAPTVLCSAGRGTRLEEVQRWLIRLQTSKFSCGADPLWMEQPLFVRISMIDLRS